MSLLIDNYVDKIVAGLFRIGFEVSPITDKYLLSKQNSPCALLGILIGSENTDVKLLRNTIEGFLNRSHIRYYSLLVSTDDSDMAWTESNIKLIRKQKIDVPYLKIVKEPENQNDKQ